MKKHKRVILASSKEQLECKINVNAHHGWIPSIPMHVGNVWYSYLEKYMQEDYEMGNVKEKRMKIKIIKTCVVCGLDFETSNKRKMYCTDKCAWTQANNTKRTQRLIYGY